MGHDEELIGILEALPVETFEGEVFRAARLNLDPTAPSTNGGRWASRGGPQVLYTSFQREGAMAELGFHLGQLTPVPTKPIQIARLAVSCNRALRLVRTNLTQLGVAAALAHEPNYERTQKIGDAVAWLELDGLIVPSARWHCDNLILYTANRSAELILEVVGVETVHWQDWGVANGLIDSKHWPPSPPA